MSEDKPPKSMRDFDYFDDGVQPAEWGTIQEIDDLPAGLEEQLEAFRRRQRRYFRYVVLMAVTIGVCVWFLAGYRMAMAYAFSEKVTPRQMGDVTALTPAEIPHNAYVTLEGITEHRGLTQKTTRGLSLARKEYWYFRLLGSQGVFIEVEPDREQYGFTTFVRVTGRAVDPTQDPAYEGLLATYHDMFFFAKKRSALRIIQVGVEPGEGQWPYILAFVLVGLLVASNLWMLWRILTLRRLAATGP